MGKGIGFTASRLLRRGFTDKITGALSLEGFKHEARKVIHRHRERNVSSVVVKLDVKDFKLINRAYSFAVGDQVIKNIAAALDDVLSDLDAVFARMGTDDFVLLMPYEGPEWLHSRRMMFISRFRTLMGKQFGTMVTFPTGQYLLTEEDFPRPDVGEILEKVNFAHRAAKHRFETIIDYEEDIEKEALFEKAIEDKMSDALTNEEFTLYLQPKYCLADETVCGAEALVRWEIDGKFYMHPTDFIPVLERNGFIIKLDKYMFQCAVEKIREFLDKGQTPVPISVNFSRFHLDNEHFVEELCEVADRYNVPHAYLEIELTESAIFGRVERIAQFIGQLHDAGFTMAMDDFGSGYSCLAQLKDLEVDVLKIDKGFFDNDTRADRTRIVVSNILHMAQELSVATVAEGVETRAHVDMLKELGCDMVQGFYYSRPIPGTELILPEEIPVR